MGRVDLDFKPAVPVFDANVALGRRHNRRQSVDTAAATIAEMDRTGVERALVYAPHAAVYDSLQGNSYLLESIAGCPRLVPQFACNPTFDHMNRFAAGLEEHGVRWVIAHAGNGPLGQDEAVAAAQACANIYLETSTSFGDSRTIEYLVQGAGAERVLFGSDMPEQELRYQLGRIVTADIPEDARRRILGLNAIELLGLEM